MELEARDLLARYVAGEIDAAELEDELEQISWDGAPGTGFVLRLLHEYANGDWTDDELRGRLEPLAHTYVWTWAKQNLTGSSAETTLQVSPGRVETLHVAVSA